MDDADETTKILSQAEHVLWVRIMCMAHISETCLKGTMWRECECEGKKGPSNLNLHSNVKIPR